MGERGVGRGVGSEEVGGGVGVGVWRGGGRMGGGGGLMGEVGVLYMRVC